MKELLRLHQSYLRALSGPDGQAVLADLKVRAFADRSSFDPDGARMAFNEGRRSLLLHVLDMLDTERFRAQDNGSRNEG